MEPMTMMALASLGMQAGGMAASMFGGKDNDHDAERQQALYTQQLLNTIQGKREYKLDEKAMKRVTDQLNQMRATGQNITPEMYDSLYRAELQTASDVALKKAEAGANVGLRATALGEQSRQFDERMSTEGEAASSKGFGELAGNLSTKLPSLIKSLTRGAGGTGGTGADQLKGMGYADPYGATKDCILVTVCHGRDSEEVNIAREYRDKFMDSETIRGYYVLSEFILPAMETSKRFAEMVKYALIDSLIEYGSYILGKIPFCSDESKEDTLGFLGVCKDIGHSIPKLIRANGEVV